jgi:hypothetical protein
MNNDIEIRDIRKKFRNQHRPEWRDSSFDFCFNYFQSFHEVDDVGKLSDGTQMEISCLQLGFYLASWGMYRGGTHILDRSAKFLETVIKEIVKADDDLWQIDLEYTPANREVITNFGKDLRKKWKAIDEWPGDQPTDTLITKIMLGVFGCVPAFDTNFVTGFNENAAAKVSTSHPFNDETLIKVSEWYLDHHSLVDEDPDFTLDINTGKPTQPKRQYPRAKVIDTIFFEYGLELERLKEAAGKRERKLK